MINKFIDNLNRRKATKVARQFGDLSSFIDLETPSLDHPEHLITRNGARCTLIEVQGSINIIGKDQHSVICEELLRAVQMLFKGDSVSISWMFEDDQLQVERALNKAISPSVHAAARVGLNIEDIAKAQVESNASVCNVETNWLALWTYPKFEQEYVKGKLCTVQTENVPLRNLHDNIFYGAVNPFKSDINTKERHSNNVEILLAAFRRAGIVVRPEKAKVAAQRMLVKANPGIADNTPIACVGDEQEGVPSVGEMLINPDTMELDTSGFSVPSLAEQIPRSTITEDSQQDGLFQVRDKYVCVNTVDVFPNIRIPFSKMQPLLKGMSYRITFVLKPKPTDLISTIKEFTLRGFAGLSEENREAYREHKLLGAMKDEYDIPPINWQMVVVTWHETRNGAMRQSDRLEQAFADWGGARLEKDNLNPVQSYFTSIAGLSNHLASQGCLIGADRLMSMLPHHSVYSLNDYGSMIFRHQSGKICMYKAACEQQDYDLTQHVARPRQGKSLAMNAKVISALSAEGSTELPLATMMDIGPSGEGAVQLIQHMLQDRYGVERARRLAVTHEWKPDGEVKWYKNPLDIRLGRSFPSEQESVFIQSFYLAECVNPETGKNENGSDAVIQTAIELLFENFVNKSPKLVNTSTYPRLDELARNYNVALTDTKTYSDGDVTECISYFEARDRFFKAGCMEGASQAHRLAMPTVDDLIDLVSSNQTLIQRFEEVHKGLLPVIASKLQTHRKRRKHLSQSTTLDLSDAHIICIDMKPIVEDSPSNEARLRLFNEYMLAMNTAIDKFFIHYEILDGMSPVFKPYWEDKIKQFGKVDKILNLDEWHALTIKTVTSDGKEISVPVGGAAYIDYLIKQAPKWRLSINMASHSPNDFTETMKGKATNVFIYSGFNKNEIETLKKDYSLNDEQAAQLETLHGPDAKRGSQMLWVYKANVDSMDGVQGSAVVEYLCSGLLLWGLNTSARDLPHKRRLQKEHPDAPWLEALLKAFPKGTMNEIRAAVMEEYRRSDLIAEQSGADIEERLYRLTLSELTHLQLGDRNMADFARKTAIEMEKLCKQHLESKLYQMTINKVKTLHEGSR